MRNYHVLSLLCSFVATQAKPVTTLYASKGGRAADVCTKKVGNGPKVVPDTVEAFLNYPTLTDQALEAASSPPEAYSLVSDWVNLHGSNGDTTGYLTSASANLTSYNATDCSALCNGIIGCISFVMYFERSPELVSSSTLKPKPPQCSADNSVTLIKCAFYSVPLYAGNATNVGSFEDKFHIVIAGSTAFTFGSPPSLSGWTGPVNLGQALLEIPTPVGDNGFISVLSYPKAAYDPRTCAAQCADYASPKPCTSFNAYVLYTNGGNGIFTCEYFSINYGASYANNIGQYDSAGVQTTYGNSMMYYKEGSPAPKEQC